MTNFLKSKTAKAAVGLIALVVFVASASSAYAAFGDHTLRAKSSWKEEVKVLQAGLNEKGFASPALVVDGAFGAKTTTAVKAYQANNGLVADGIFGPKSFAKWGTTTGGNNSGSNSNCQPGWAFDPATGAPCSGGSQPQTGPVAASLAQDNPASQYIVAGQATADLLHINFTGSGTINSVTLTRSGISDQSTLTNVYLYDGVTRLTDGYSFNTNGIITMNNLNIPVNGSKVISVKADVYSSTTSNTVVVSLTSFTAGTSVNTVNVPGNSMAIANGSSLASASISGVNQVIGNPVVNAGSTAYTVWQAPMSVNLRTLYLKAANFRIVGSAPTGAVANAKLYIDGTQVGTVANLVTTTGSNYLSFDLSTAPVQLTTGAHQVEVRADIVGGSSYNFTVSLQQASDLMVFDPQVGVNIALSGTIPNNAAQITIGAGSSTISVDPTFSALTNVTGGGNQATIARFKVHGYGEDVKVTSLPITPVLAGATPTAAGLQNVTLYFNGSQVGSQTASWSSGTITLNLGSQLIIPANTDSILEIKADLKTTGGANYTAGTISANLGAGTAEGWSSHTTITTPAVNGTTLNIQTGLLAVSANASYSNQSISPNSTGVKIGSFTLQNQSTSESVRVNSLKVDLAFAAPTYTSGTVTTGSQAITVSSSTGFTVGNVITIPGATAAVGTVTAITDATHIQVNITTGGVTPTAGGAIVGSGSTTGPAILTNFAALNTSEGTIPVQPQASYTFSVNFTLAPGATKTIDIMADTSSANLGAVTTSLTVGAIGVSSNVSVSQNGTGTPVAGQTLTLAAGTVTNSATSPKFVDSSSTTAQYVASPTGKTDATKATFNFVSTGGSSTITDLRFTVTGPVTQIRVGNATATPQSGVVWLQFNPGLVVTNSPSGLNVDAYVSYGTVGATGQGTAAVTGATSTVTLTQAKYTSAGVSTTLGTGGTAFTNGSLGSPSMTLTASTPTVKKTSSPVNVGTGSTSNVKVGTVSITANDGDVSIGTVPLTVGVPTGGTSAGWTVKVSGTAPNGITQPTSDTSGFSFANGYTITSGQTVAFDVYVNFSGVTTAGNADLTIGSAASFKWSDIADGLLTNAAMTKTGATLSTYNQ